MIDTLHVATYNIHKGFSNFNRRMVVHELRDRLRLLGADLVFLQEVLGDHQRHAQRFANWPEEPQYEFLADSVWRDFAYGRNSVYDLGHHGNAVLSRYPLSAELRRAVLNDDLAALAPHVNAYLLRFYFAICGVNDAEFIRRLNELPQSKEQVSNHG